ncbi:MAG: glycosyltransferase [Dehalococcoidales bacterium]
MATQLKAAPPVSDGTVYSSRKGIHPFSTPPLDKYAAVTGEENIEKLGIIARRLKGLKIMELNATAQGGGVAEMLFSSIPFLDLLGIDIEWKVLHGNQEYYECTKSMHNLLQGMQGSFTKKMKDVYINTLLGSGNEKLIDSSPDVVVAHDPQPLGLCSFFKKPGETWLWRCHIDIEEASVETHPALWNAITGWVEKYDASIFSAAHYVVPDWSLPKFIIPPFIDPLSEKNREMAPEEIERVLVKYQIDSRVPIVAQIGRFDQWKGLDRTIETYRLVRQEVKCQLVLAGGFASDDPEGEKILAGIREKTKEDKDIHILNLSLDNRLDNFLEVNALQRASSVIMQPSTREGFGLVITEALWKGKPVIASNVGAIPLQIRDGDTGYFYKRANETALKVIHLLNNKEDASLLGERGRKYVREHFLLPNRIADYLLTIEMSLNKAGGNRLPKESVISFHPWFKLSKRVTAEI